MPQLMKHLDNLSCELSPVTFNWFMTIFVDSLPVEVKPDMFLEFLLHKNLYTFL